MVNVLHCTDIVGWLDHRPAKINFKTKIAADKYSNKRFLN